MRTARTLPYGGISQTETPLDRDPQTEIPWTETPLETTPSCGQTNTCENITFRKTCLRVVISNREKKALGIFHE